MNSKAEYEVQVLLIYYLVYVCQVGLYIAALLFVNLYTDVRSDYAGENIVVLPFVL